MKRIKEIVKLTDNKYLNLYKLIGVNKKDNKIEYFMASRKDKNNLSMLGNKSADGVMIYGIYGGDKIVLIKQYRYCADDFVYELPAGLVDKGENFEKAGIREFKEETGLKLDIVPADIAFTKPSYTTVGLSDERVATVFGIATGDVSYEGLEDNEDLEVVLADRKEALRILREEEVAAKCRFLLLKFIYSDNDNVLKF